MAPLPTFVEDEATRVDEVEQVPQQRKGVSLGLRV